jgi:hypothetical protein
MSKRAWMAFASVSVLWGIPYLFIKIAVDDGVPPGLAAAVTRVRPRRGRVVPEATRPPSAAESVSI